MKTTPNPISAKEFDQLFKKVCNWGRWGTDNERGTLNYITAEHIRSVAGLVRAGRSVSGQPHSALEYVLPDDFEDSWGSY